MIWNVIRTVAFPRLPLVKGADFVQDVSGSMKEPDKTYAREEMAEKAKKCKIVVALDYELTTFEINESYVDRQVGVIADNIYRNQPYILFTYFKDTKTLNITTNVNSDKFSSKKIENVENDTQLAEDIWYNLKEINPDMGIKNWNFNLNTEAARNVALASVGSIIFLILGIGVFPNDAWKWPEFRKRTRKQSTHSAE